MLEDLACVKLPKGRRADVLAARTLLRANGRLPLGMVMEIRSLYRRHGRALSELHLAREAAKRRQALTALGLTEDDADELRKSRLAELRRKLTDLGI